MRRKAAADRAEKTANLRPSSTRAAGAGGSSSTMLSKSCPCGRTLVKDSEREMHCLYAQGIENDLDTQEVHDHPGCGDGEIPWFRFWLEGTRNSKKLMGGPGLYTDESPGLKVDPVVVMTLSVVFIFSVVALHGMCSPAECNVLLLTKNSHRQGHAPIFCIEWRPTWHFLTSQSSPSSTLWLALCSSDAHIVASISYPFYLRTRHPRAA